jgi:hypothetical protein
MNLAKRIEALESKIGPQGIAEVTIHGGIPDLGPDDHATVMPSETAFSREPDEEPETFRDRVRDAAFETKATRIVFGGLPKDNPEVDPLRPVGRGGAA